MTKFFKPWSIQQFIGVYDRISSRYEALHARFLRLAGGEAQAALEAAVVMMLQPGLKVLDAGCGTGALARRLLRREPQLDLTLVDASTSMLREARGIDARRLHGFIAQLPVKSDLFDLSIACWVLETVADPVVAVRELLRVTRPGGHLCLAFCAAREDVDALDRLLISMIRLRGTGRLLDSSNIRAILAEAECTDILSLPCRGPVAAMVARVGERRVSYLRHVCKEKPGDGWSYLSHSPRCAPWACGVRVAHVSCSRGLCIRLQSCGLRMERRARSFLCPCRPWFTCCYRGMAPAAAYPGSN